MPTRDETPGGRLAALYDEGRFTKLGLARALARLDGTKVESKRRWLTKLLRGDIEHPDPKTLREIAQVLDLEPGYLIVEGGRDDGVVQIAPTRRQLERRLEEAEAGLARLGRLTERLGRRVAALERQATPRTQQGGR